MIDSLRILLSKLKNTALELLKVQMQHIYIDKIDITWLNLS